MKRKRNPIDASNSLMLLGLGGLAILGYYYFRSKNQPVQAANSKPITAQKLYTIPDIIPSYGPKLEAPTFSQSIFSAPTPSYQTPAFNSSGASSMPIAQVQHSEPAPLPTYIAPVPPPAPPPAVFIPPPPAMPISSPMVVQLPTYSPNTIAIGVPNQYLSPLQQQNQYQQLTQQAARDYAYYGLTPPPTVISLGPSLPMNTVRIGSLPRSRFGYAK
jgi:hypothetical protein